MKFDLTTIGWHPPGYVKFILLIYFIILVSIISISISQCYEYFIIKRFFRSFRKKLGDLKSKKEAFLVIEDNLQKHKYSIFNCSLSGLLDILQLINGKQDKSPLLFHIKVHFLQNRINQLLSIKKSRLLFLCFVTISLAIFVAIIEIYKILQNIFSDKYSLKIGFFSLKDSALPVAIICMVIVFFSVLSYLIMKRINSLLSLEIEDIPFNILKKDFSSKNGIETEKNNL